MHGYRYGLFDCFEDPAIFCQVCLCVNTFIPSACNFARSRRDEFSVFHWLCPAPPIWTRANIRRLRGYNQEHFCEDSLIYLCCCQLATCQDALELKDLNLDPLPYTEGPTAPEVPPPPPGFTAPMLGVPPAGYMPPGYAYIIPPQYQVPGNYQPGYPMPYAGPVEDIPAA